MAFVHVGGASSITFLCIYALHKNFTGPWSCFQGAWLHADLIIRCLGRTALEHGTGSVLAHEDRIKCSNNSKPPLALFYTYSPVKAYSLQPMRGAVLRGVKGLQYISKGRANGISTSEEKSTKSLHPGDSNLNYI
jgi:hypothetical protein